MAFPVTQSFKRTTKSLRFEGDVMSKAEMIAGDDTKFEDGYLVVEKDSHDVYIYDEDATPTTETGRFIKLNTGPAGGDDNIYYITIPLSSLTETDTGYTGTIDNPTWTDVIAELNKNPSPYIVVRLISDPTEPYKYVFDIPIASNGTNKNASGGALTLTTKLEYTVVSLLEDTNDRIKVIIKLGDLSGGGTTYTAGSGIKIVNNEISTTFNASASLGEAVDGGQMSISTSTGGGYATTATLTSHTNGARFRVTNQYPIGKDIILTSKDYVDSKAGGAQLTFDTETAGYHEATISQNSKNLSFTNQNGDGVLIGGISENGETVTSKSYVDNKISVTGGAVLTKAIMKGANNNDYVFIQPSAERSIAIGWKLGTLNEQSVDLASKDYVNNAIIAAAPIKYGTQTIDDGTWIWKIYSDMSFEAHYKKTNISLGITNQSGNFYRSNSLTMTLPGDLTAYYSPDIMSVNVQCGHSGYPTTGSMETITSDGFTYYVVSGGSRNQTSGYTLTASVYGTVTDVNIEAPFYYGNLPDGATTLNSTFGLTEDPAGKSTRRYFYSPQYERPCIVYPASYGNLVRISDENGFNCGPHDWHTGTFIENGVEMKYYIHPNNVTTDSTFYIYYFVY